MLANPFELRRLCASSSIILGDMPIIDLVLARCSGLRRALLQNAAGTLPEDAGAQMRDPLWFGTMMLAQGDTDLCIAGNGGDRLGAARRPARYRLAPASRHSRRSCS